MNDRFNKIANPASNHINDVILISDPSQQQQYDFETLNQFKHSRQQQQEVMPVFEEVGLVNLDNPQFKSNENTNFLSNNVLPESQLQKQFEEIRFGETQCNLMDLDLQHQPGQKSILQSTPYEYEKFIFNRSIEIETPLLINEGYIMSYKLYQIKTRVLNQNENNHQNHDITFGPNQKLPNKSNDDNYQVPQAKRPQKTLPNNRKQSSELKSIKPNSNPDPTKYTQLQSQDAADYDTCVSRRFSDFEYLNELLIAKYGGFIIPLLPQKNFWTIINLEGKQYAETRTKSLVKYLNRLFTHKTLKHSEELKHFLFEQDSKFSTQKGEYYEKNKRIEDKIVSIGSGALGLGKALYSRFLGGAEKSRNQQEIRLSKSKLNKEDLLFGEYEIVVGELMRIVGDVKGLVENTIEEMQTLEDINVLFSSGLTDAFNMPTISVTGPTDQNLTKTKRNPQILLISQPLPTLALSEQFEQISQFISSCHAAIQRRKSLRQQMEQLRVQQLSLQQKYKNSPRSLELDLVRSKLSKLNKMNATYADELIKELEFHVDEGKGMLKGFVGKFEQVRRHFFGSK